MASTTEPNHRHPINNISRFIQTATSSLSSLLPFPKPPAPALPSSPISSTTPCVPPSRICVPLLFPDSTVQLLPLHPPSPFESTQPDSMSSGPSSSASASYSALGGGFPSSVRISRLSSAEKGGPAFVGQVFSMCDLSGTGLMAVSKHFDIPFISKSTPEWIKKIFASVTESKRDGPVFRFFMDLGDAVSYVRQLNIPSGVVGACRLDLAYDHFKEKPHLFQFVPNEKQVKEANKLLKIMPHNNGRRKRVDGVPVFSAQNLDIAIATTDGIKWYTPYFFDKNMLDNILEESADQHFHAMIKTRNLRRQREVTDDNVGAEMIEETKESMEELPEVLDAMMDTVLDEGIPMSAISKAAEILLLHAVDNVLLGNRWLRKATGIQPKFPYMVDSFEERSVASLLRASESSSSEANSEVENSKYLLHHDTSELTSKDSVQAEQGQRPSFGFPFGDWSRHPFSNQPNHNQPDKRVESGAGEYKKQEPQHSPLLPKITMVGISTAEAGQVSKASLKKTMEDLTRELEQKDQGNADGSTSAESKCEDRDPLFVANVGDYFSGASRKGSARWVRREFD